MIRHGVRSSSVTTTHTQPLAHGARALEIRANLDDSPESALAKVLELLELGPVPAAALLQSPASPLHAAAAAALSPPPRTGVVVVVVVEVVHPAVVGGAGFFFACCPYPCFACPGAGACEERKRDKLLFFSDLTVLNTGYVRG